jgi:hypothetical protein
MRNIFFLTVFLFLTVVRANDKKICIFLGAKKLEDHQQDNYRLASFYCKDGQDESFDESNWPLRKKDYPLNKEKDNIFSIKYLKMNKVIKTIKFKFVERPSTFFCREYNPNSQNPPTKEELERERREKEMSAYHYEQRFLIKDEAFADEIQIFKSKKLVISSKINFDYYKGN